MLNMKQTRLVHAQHMPVAAGFDVLDEGIALATVLVDGVACVKPATGAATEVFAGVSWSRNVMPTQVGMVVEEVIPTDLTIDLGRVPITGQINVRKTAAADGTVTVLTVVSVAAANATEIQLTAAGKLIAFAGEAGNTITATFQYTPSATEARMLQKGNTPSGQLASTQEGIIGVITNAQELSTSYFDASVDWTSVQASGAPQPVKLAANGLFTIGGSGITVPNCTILSVPGVDTPFLTLKLGQ